MNNRNGNIIYLVTGAADFLGGTFCRQLIERGDAVRAFVLKDDLAMRFVPVGPLFSPMPSLNEYARRCPGLPGISEVV